MGVWERGARGRGGAGIPRIVVHARCMCAHAERRWRKRRPTCPPAPQTPHPQSDKLYVETIDLGEASPRQILSGLAQHMSLDQVKGADVVVICNLKARKMAGVESQGMVLCASDAAKSNLCFVTPPPGSKPGELVSWDGYPGTAESAKRMEKKKAWEAIAPELVTAADGTACYKDKPFKLSSGVCTSKVASGIIS